MANSRGWGTGQGAEGLIPEPPVTPEDMIDDIRLIREKYVVAANMDVRPFNLGAYDGLRSSFIPQTLNALLVTVVGGTVYIYFGDFSSQFGRAPAIPHFTVSAGVVPTSVQIALPKGEEYVICVQEGLGATAAGSIVGMAI